MNKVIALYFVFTSNDEVIEIQVQVRGGEMCIFHSCNLKKRENIYTTEIERLCRNGLTASTVARVNGYGLSPLAD